MRAVLERWQRLLLLGAGDYPVVGLHLLQIEPEVFRYSRFAIKRCFVARTHNLANRLGVVFKVCERVDKFCEERVLAEELLELLSIVRVTGVHETIGLAGLDSYFDVLDPAALFVPPYRGVLFDQHAIGG